MRKICLCILAAVLLWAAPCAAYEEDPGFMKDQRASLEGIKSFAVLVEKLEGEEPAGRINMRTLQKDIEFKLKTSGVELAEDVNESEGIFIGLKVRVELVSPIGQQNVGWVSFAQLYVMQPAWLVSNKKLIHVKSWDLTSYAFTPIGGDTEQLMETLRNQVSILASGLMYDYASAN